MPSMTNKHGTDKLINREVFPSQQVYGTKANNETYILGGHQQLEHPYYRKNHCNSITLIE